MKKYFGIILAIIVVGVVLWGGYAQFHKASEKSLSAVSAGIAKYANAKGEIWTIPKGEFQFNISSAEKYPKMITGIISPLDVKVGDIQKMMIALNGDAPMTRVWAEVETDNGTKIIELALSATSTVSMADRLKEPYFVDEKGFLVVNDGKNNDIAKKLVNTAEATAGVIQYRYEGEWKVEDTHTKTYHTKFIAEDTAGRKDSTILAWSDPSCNFDSFGNLLTPTCAPAAGDIIGFDGGVATIPNGATVTLTGAGSAFAFNGGTNGSIQIVPGGKIGTAVAPITSTAPIQQAFMWYTDADSDTYTPNVQVYATTSVTWAGHIRVKDVSGKGTGASYQVPVTTSTDCYDSNANAKPGQTSFFSANRGDGSFDYDCDGKEYDSFSSQQSTGPVTALFVCSESQQNPYAIGWPGPGYGNVYDCSQHDGSGFCLPIDTSQWQDVPNCWGGAGYSDLSVLDTAIPICGDVSDAVSINGSGLQQDLSFVGYDLPPTQIQRTCR